MFDEDKRAREDKESKLGYQLFLKGKKAEEFVQELARARKT